MYSISSGVLIIPFVINILLYLLFGRIIHKNKSFKMNLLDIAFLAYGYTVIGLLYFPLQIGIDNDLQYSLSINFMPLTHTVESMKRSLSASDSMYEFAYIIGNILLFAPLSFYLKIRFPTQMERNLLTVLIISISAEPLQLLLMLMTNSANRIIDIDDLIFNATGGVGAWMMARSMLSQKTKRVPV